MTIRWGRANRNRNKKDRERKRKVREKEKENIYGIVREGKCQREE